MLGVLGGIIALGIAYLFYRTAESKGAPALQWALVGAVSYYLTNLIWTFQIAKPYVVQLHQTTGSFKTALISHSGMLLGAVCAWLIWTFILSKIKKPG